MTRPLRPLLEAAAWILGALALALASILAWAGLGWLIGHL